MTLNGVMAVILCYFSEFAYLPGVLRKSLRSLSHLLMSSYVTYVSNARYITHHYDDTCGVCAYLLVDIRVVLIVFTFLYRCRLVCRSVWL